MCLYIYIYLCTQYLYNMHAVPWLTRSPAQPQSLTHRLTNGFICQSPSFFLYLSTYLLYVPAYLLMFPLTNCSLIIHPFKHSHTHPFPPSIPFFLPSSLRFSICSLVCWWILLGPWDAGLQWRKCSWIGCQFVSGNCARFCVFFGRMPQCHKGSTRETLGGHIRMIWWSLKRKSPKAFVDRALFSKNPWGQRVKRDGKWRLRMMSLIWRNLEIYLLKIAAVGTSIFILDK